MQIIDESGPVTPAHIAAVTAKPATSLDVFLRRADVEGLLQTKIDAGVELLADIESGARKLREGDSVEQIAARIGALRVTKNHLGHCEQFDHDNMLGDMMTRALPVFVAHYEPEKRKENVLELARAVAVLAQREGIKINVPLD